jgi:hypothetical protein
MTLVGASDFGDFGAHNFGMYFTPGYPEVEPAMGPLH